MLVGTPKESQFDAFQKVTVEDITIYLPKNAEIKQGGIMISLHGISILKQLQVSGLC